MKLVIAATAALLTGSGLAATTAARADGPPPVADGTCIVITDAGICVNNLCVYWEVDGVNPLPVQDPFCVPTPLPDGCTLDVPPNNINDCIPPMTTEWSQPARGITS